MDRHRQLGLLVQDLVVLPREALEVLLQEALVVLLRGR
jgi:hypothetical protein